MKRIEMEHIGYVPHVPQPGPHPGTLPFVQINAERCVGCDTCHCLLYTSDAADE